MNENTIEYDGRTYRPFRSVCIAIIPPTDTQTVVVDPNVEESINRIVTQLGPGCRINRLQWIVKSDEPCAAIWQDIYGVTDCNLLVFAFLADADFKFSCKPQSALDEWDYDGIAAFFQGNPAIE